MNEFNIHGSFVVNIKENSDGCNINLDHAEFAFLMEQFSMRAIGPLDRLQLEEERAHIVGLKICNGVCFGAAGKMIQKVSHIKTWSDPMMWGLLGKEAM